MIDKNDILQILLKKIDLSKPISESLKLPEYGLPKQINSN